jgi:hypothetical protein
MFAGLVAMAASGAAKLAMNWASEQLKQSMSARAPGSREVGDTQPLRSNPYPPR